MTENFNARIEWTIRPPRNDFDWVDNLMDLLQDFHPAIGSSVRGFIEAVVTLPAENLRQALAAITPIAQETAASFDAEVLAIEVMPTVEYDARAGLAPLPELLSVTQAANRLGISAQAIRQRLESGTLPGAKVGATWVVNGSQMASTNRNAERVFA